MKIKKNPDCPPAYPCAWQTEIDLTPFIRIWVWIQTGKPIQAQAHASRSYTDQTNPFYTPIYSAFFTHFYYKCLRKLAAITYEPLFPLRTRFHNFSKPQVCITNHRRWIPSNNNKRKTSCTASWLIARHRCGLHKCQSRSRLQVRFIVNKYYNISTL